MSDRREAIVAAGLAVIRESGFAGFTQPRVAAKAGLRQSNLTYYFPTRADLLAAVARAAIDGQLAAIDAMLDGRSIEAASAVIANVAVRHENTRVMMALAQAADQEPRVRELFRELADGIALRAGRLLEDLGLPSTAENRFLVHALSVGLAVVDLAVDRPDGAARAASVLETTFTLLAKGSGE
ncbi:MAG: TetR family transcriptional regulator [Amaricoccus sp.]|uniref:TetR/AcrR family transcriptional regulator n=1 Tax=Amaricoccus sp. TaxID=1872485 RepID=UPI0033155848